jgi:hypothetical protein
VSSATPVEAVRCVVCGRAVQLDRRRGDRRKTCSRECHRALIGLSNQRKKRSQRHIAKIKAGIGASPLTGPYESNRNAKRLASFRPHRTGAQVSQSVPLCSNPS